MLRSPKWIPVLLIGCGIVVVDATTVAAGFPERPVRFVVGYAPGGGADILTRFIGRKLSETWGVPVVVENRAGAGGIIAARLVAQAPPDGYTILMITTNHTVPLPDGENPGYDPLKNYAPVTEIAYIPSVLVVNPSLPVTGVKDLIQLAKAKPGQLNFGSTGPGTAQFMDMHLFMKWAGIRMVNVTYKGAAPILVAILGGEVQLSLSPITAFLESIRSGKVRALAVSGKIRSPLLPSVPTYPEAVDGKGFEGSANWYGIVAPAGTPKALVGKLHGDIITSIKTPDVQRLLSEQAFITVGGSPDEFTRHITADLAKWSNIMKTIELK